MAAVALLALILVYVLVLVPDKKDQKASAADVGGLTTAEKQAVVAAGTEAANLLSFRRATFDADYQRALDGATGSLRSDVASKKALTKKSLTTGKFDLGATVTHQALEGPIEKGGNGYLVLVTVNAYRSTTTTAPVSQDLEITMVETAGKWLASDVQSIGAVQ
ncbi:hypothetical protein [uncultured Jatrophihabitans sp.]|uniref:hypothetical protein n=1 Tax=uncultured Jatrophihabitans sp. TaxID=1610747 RepID=UPI0035C9B126